MRICLLVILLTLSGIIYGQDTVYVNTDNLIVRDLPESEYNVYAVVQPSCPLVRVPVEDYYLHNKAVTARFYCIKITYWSDPDHLRTLGGWVEKRYMVKKLSDVKGWTPDKQLPQVAKLLLWTDECNTCDYNAAEFPPPKYKGGERYIPPHRDYYKGPRGGCYYIGANGNKNYVHSRHCR